LESRPPGWGQWELKMEKIKSLLDWILDKIVTVSLMVVVGTVVGQVFFRYVLHDPLVGSEDFAKLFFVWMVFLGTAVVTRDRMHIQVDYFVEKLPLKPRKIVDLGIHLLTLIFFLIILKYAFDFIAVQKGMRSVGLDIPLAAYSSAVIFGSIFVVFYLLHSLLRGKKGQKEDAETQPILID
jgi:TRAP-type C4-dicarboxylate transport system permease small subunit